jgi:polyphosphate kinase
LQQVVELLKEQGIIISAMKALSARERISLRNDFAENIYPLLTPQSIDPAHPFPFISNLSLNLEARVEVLCPVEVPALVREIRSILDVHLQDTRSAWDMQPDGSYIQRMPADLGEAGASHCQLIELTEKRVELYRNRMKSKKIKTEVPPLPH